MKSRFTTIVCASLLFPCCLAYAQPVDSTAPSQAAVAPEQTASSPLPSMAGESAAPVKTVDVPVPVSMFESVKVNERPFYHGSGLFALGGAIGGLIASKVYEDEPARIADFVKQEGIDIGALVKSEFERQFEQSPQAKAALEKKGPGKFQMTILYGITSVPFSDYRPYLSIRMRLLDASGNEKWKDREYEGGHGKAKSIPYPDFYKSAKVFTSEFEECANEVVGLLLSDFTR